jgi:hypothetical protein
MSIYPEESCVDPFTSVQSITMVWEWKKQNLYGTGIMFSMLS